MGVVCCTYDRPQYVGQIIRCFLDQDYPDRELVVLDDAGQYESQKGDRWRLVSVPNRYPTLGHKRNAAVSLLSPDVEAICTWDDDDLYLPWTVASCAKALGHGDWAVPSVIFKQESPGCPLVRIVTEDPSWALGAAWAISLRAFREAGGYGLTISGEDTTLKERLNALGAVRVDSTAGGPGPYFIWRRCPDTYHASEILTLVQWRGVSPRPRMKKIPVVVPVVVPDANPATALLEQLSQDEWMMQL
jgi:hypothetical protein